MFTSLGTDFSVPEGWPVPVEARVVDDCGDPIASGSALASFSSGDQPLALVPLRDGRWSGTWQARAMPVVLTVAGEASPAVTMAVR